MIRRLTLVVALLGALPMAALGQTVRVVTGEHADFTRLVMQIPAGLTWSLMGSGPERIFAPSTDLTFDLSRVFDRIPRTRLESARAGDGRLTLGLACDCPVRAWQDRPGLVIIDISDPTPPEQAPAAPPPAVTAAPRPGIDRARTAREVGEQLAREHAERTASQTETEIAVDADLVAGIAADLGQQFARALGQGLLESVVEPTTSGAVLRPDASVIDLPANMRIVDVTQRPDIDAPPPQSPDPACRGSEALDFLLDRSDAGFSQGLGQYGQSLFGEFDQASDRGFLDLVQHYLAAGFGAEARSLISNLRDPLPGREILLGFSDVLEGRMSNSRMRLAEALNCGGAAAIGALLARPETAALNDIAPAITLSFGRLPPGLQAILGADLVRALIAGDALDEARIVSESLRRSPWAAIEDITLADALLEGVRGDPARSAEHLDSIALRTLDGTIAWLDLALDEGTAVAASALDDAEALAAEHRGTSEGLSIMAAVVRLRARSSQPDSALVTLDRLEAWEGNQRESAGLIDALKDEVWSHLTQTTDDHGLIALTLSRSDWLDPDLSLETRQALARRLVDLGFARAADRLLAPETDSQSLRLRALAALAQDDTATAIPLIEGDPSDEALQIRAAAASREGRFAEAAALLDAAGVVDAAARAVILDGDWRLLADLRTRGARPDALPEEANGFLGLSPGVAEIMQSRDAEPVSAGAPAPEPDRATTQGIEPVSLPEPQDPEPTSGTAANDPAEVFDRLGLVTRAGVLLAESERLRDAIGRTLQAGGQP